MSFIQHERSVDSGSPHGGATGQADSPTVAVAASDSRSVIPGRLRDVGGDIGLTSGRIVKEGRGVFEVLGGGPGSGTDDGKEEDRIVSIPVFHTEGELVDVRGWNEGNGAFVASFSVDTGLLNTWKYSPLKMPK